MNRNVFTVVEITLIVGLLVGVLYFGGVFDLKPSPRPNTIPLPTIPAVTPTPTLQSTATIAPSPTATPTFITPTLTLSSVPLNTPVIPPLSQPSGLIAFETSRDGNREIYILNADGTGQPRNLTHSLAEDTSPAWSPNGQRIAFFSTRNGSPEIYVMDGDGANVTQVTHTRSTNIIYEPPIIWSQDGQEILIVRRVVGGGYDQPDTLALELLQADGSGATTLFEVNGLYLKPSWSPDRRHLYIYVLDQGPVRQTFSWYLGTLLGSQYEFKCGTDSLLSDTYLWLPDSSRLAFEDDNHNLVTITPDGSERQQLINTSGYIFLQPISWSPDGQYLLYAASGPNSGGFLHVVQVDGLAGLDFDAGVRPDDYDSAIGVNWPPDSQWLTYEQGGDLFVVSLYDSANPIQLTHSGDNAGPQWQPVP